MFCVNCSETQNVVVNEKINIQKINTKASKAIAIHTVCYFLKSNRSFKSDMNFFEFNTTVILRNSPLFVVFLLLV
jgi:hypothetical protein